MRCNTRSAISMQNVRLGVTATTDDRDDVLIDPGTKKLSLKSERLLKNEHFEILDPKLQTYAGTPMNN